MTDEKMTDKTLANALAQQEAEYFQRHVDLTSKQYNLLLKLFQGAADSCLAEGRRRCAEESKEREKQAAREAFQICIMEPDLKITNPYPQTKTEWLLEYWQQQREGREK